MIHVFIVDDTRLYREGLAHSLGRHGEIAIVGTAANREESLDRIRELQPDLVLVQMAMPESLATLRTIVDTSPSVRVVAIGVTESEREVIACAEAGISGYLLRDGSLHDLVATIQSVARGETLCSPRIAATLLRRLAALATERQSWKMQAHLTPRELEIVQCIDLGLSNKEIAQRLSIEVRTVKNHVHNILEKLQVHRRGEAAARMREGRLIRNGELGPVPVRD
jgi:two-component system nitrate/nitrite response regulator NarL